MFKFVKVIQGKLQVLYSNTMYNDDVYLSSLKWNVTLWLLCSSQIN